MKRWIAPSRLAASWLARLPPRTVRLRLTLLYGALFLVSGAVLLAITYLLVRHATGNTFLFRDLRGGPPGPTLRRLGQGVVPNLTRLPAYARQALADSRSQHAAELHQLLIQSGIALAIMTVVSIGLGWLMAGRVLRPLRTMTATTKRISARNLHERLALAGPRDELRDLADTFDGLLERLERSFGAQKRFVANAAHELRTPLTLSHALLEETLTDPGATLASFRRTSTRVLAISRQQERLLESLLTLASSERGLERHESFDLALLADDVLVMASAKADALALGIDASLSPAPTAGDPALAERLVANLIDNAVGYNVAGGHVRVTTGSGSGRALVSVSNSGPRVPDDQVERLFDPFQRLQDDRTSSDDEHHGLGLSIVRAIAAAHGADVTARANAHGGLTVEVGFPLVGGGVVRRIPAERARGGSATSRPARPYAAPSARPGGR